MILYGSMVNVHVPTIAMVRTGGPIVFLSHVSKWPLVSHLEFVNPHVSRQVSFLGQRGQT